MHAAALIARKRDGHALTDGQIADLIRGFVEGAVPDYQMSAFAMAVVWRGMTDAETAALTRAMLGSGITLSWPAGNPVADKHSTGGLGDKTSLILAPLLASCGLRVPMLSGRGLGPTGGTLDKLESIPGFRTDLSIPGLQSIVEQVGCVITGTTPELVPADRRLYALRDVTGTVPSIPLITASIMSKKLAESPAALVLDVKWGSGAFMQTRMEARQLAESMVRVGSLMDVPTTALITDMNQPLGRMSGNAIEVQESLDCLHGGGPGDLRRCVLELGIELLLLTGRAAAREEAQTLLERQLDSGAACERFERMVHAQGGDLSARRPVATATVIECPVHGRLRQVDTAQLGLSIIDLGGGRKQVGDAIDHSVGIETLVRIGDCVSAGQPLVRVFADSVSRSNLDHIAAAFQFGEPTDTSSGQELIVERHTTSARLPACQD